MDYTRLSKTVSYALRHKPEEFNLKLDKEGFVLLEELLQGLNQSGKFAERIEKTDIEYVIAHSDKRRLEIVGEKIRALYGHSKSASVTKEAGVPSAILYHGTARRFIDSIKQNGLLPMSRQYVHLSADIEMAVRVGERRDNSPIILTIDAKQAFADGIKFYYGNERVWLCDSIPAKYIKFQDK